LTGAFKARSGDGAAGSIFTPQIVHPRRRIGARTFDFSRQVAVMGIVNRTPNSFHDQGRTFALDRAIAAFHGLVEEGADWVDIGGVPFGTDARDVTEEEELARVLPVLEAVKPATDAVISVDTFRTEVARRAIDAGAGVVNDTSGLHDPALADLVAEAGATLVIVHSLASPPRSKLANPTYRDVVRDIAGFLASRVELALERGVAPHQIVLDPGHDLNKNTLHSLELTRRLSEIVALGYPVMAAVSNKDFIGETLGVPQHERLEGTIAAAVMCILQGARIVRLHDVPSGVKAVRMTEAILGWREPAYLRHNLPQV
jgi:dihydropteroate synthase